MFAVHSDVDVTRPISRAAVSRSRQIADNHGHTVYKSEDGRQYVTSYSEPGSLYITTHLGCECKGFHYRGYCSHFVAAADQTF